ncbi:MAG: hypothetical protein KC423_14755, partial [Anaerolineales bacterium]|nr:hypothetical protein [Anaerolineales bacterium]
MFRLSFTRQLVSKLIIFFVVSIMGWLTSLYQVHAADCAVPSGGYLTVQTAVNDPQCTLIILEPGTYFENITISHDLAIIGAGDQASVLDGNHAGSVVTIQPNLTVQLSNLVLQNGSGLFGNG